MAQSIADLICEYWRDPDAFLEREIKYSNPEDPDGSAVVCRIEVKSHHASIEAERAGHQVSVSIPSHIRAEEARVLEVAQTLDRQIVRTLIHLAAPFAQAVLLASAEFREGIDPWQLARRRDETTPPPIPPASPVKSAYEITPKPWAPVAGLKTIFHARGRFRAPDGRCFDYVFPELLARPDIPAELLPALSCLQVDGSRFQSRLGRTRSPISQWENWI